MAQHKSMRSRFLLETAIAIATGRPDPYRVLAPHDAPFTQADRDWFRRPVKV